MSGRVDIHKILLLIELNLIFYLLNFNLINLLRIQRS